MLPEWPKLGQRLSAPTSLSGLYNVAWVCRSTHCLLKDSSNEAIPLAGLISGAPRSKRRGFLSDVLIENSKVYCPAFSGSENHERGTTLFEVHGDARKWLARN